MRPLLQLAVWLAPGIGAVAAPAAPLTVLMTGTLTEVSAPAETTDGSLQVGSPYSLTMTYEDSVADLDPSASFGDFRIDGAFSSYEVVVGNYTFSAAGTLAIGIDQDNAFGEDRLAWFVDQFSVSGVLPPGVGPGAVTFSDIQLVGSSLSTHVSDRLLDLPWDRSLYEPDDFAFWLSIQLVGPGIGAQQGINLLGTIDTMSVLPEPAPLLLLAGVAACAALRRARAR